MKNLKRLFSLMLSCSIAGLSSVSPSVYAVGNSKNAPVQYDSTKSTKSKDLVTNSEPFKVFDIYNAYYGLTTAVPVTTTKPVTTTVTTASTKLTTKQTATTTTKLTTTTTSATTTTTTVTSPETTSTEELTTTTTTTTTIVATRPVFCNGIDVSEHQGEINWQAVKDSGLVDFVIIRAGYGKELNQVDDEFYRNIEGAKAVGLDVGIYWYSYADDMATAKQEAEVCYQLIKDYDLDYPIYFDIEEGKHVNMTIAQTSVIVDTFCSEMENRGYYTGVYSYANFLQSHIYKSVLDKYDVWVAQYSTQLTAYSGNYNIWQYSSAGAIDGIDGNVDVNYCYKDYSEIIQSNPNPNFVPKETTTVTTGDTTTVSTETTVTTTAPKVLCDIVNADDSTVDWSTYENETVMLAVNNSGAETDFDLLAENIDSVKAGSHKIGLIWYADKTTAEEIVADAEKLHSFIEEYQLEYPIYLDLTNPVISDSELSSDDISELIRAFCSVFDIDKKHYIGIRGYDDFLTDSVNDDIYEDYDVWLITDDEEIRFRHRYGIISRLISDDTISYYENECLRNYPAIMIEYHLNGF